MDLQIQFVAEEQPGSQWRALFDAFWPSYKRWYLQEGEKHRPRFLTCIQALQKYMPELVPLYEDLLKLIEGDTAARFLSLYRPPPFLSGCTQAVWTGDTPRLIRNYDYDPRFWEGVFLKTNWLGRPVIAASDCLWGVLDGINGAGLCTALAFGGSKRTGEGFGMPLILRYLLQSCSTTAAGIEVLSRVPSHMSYNVTLLDQAGDYANVYVEPELEIQVERSTVTANHQPHSDWDAYIKGVRSREREAYLINVLDEKADTFDVFQKRFLKEPLYFKQPERGYTTLYTSVYNPQDRAASYIWPTRNVATSFEQFPLQGFALTLDLD